MVYQNIVPVSVAEMVKRQQNWLTDKGNF